MLDVLGLADNVGADADVLNEFKEAEEIERRGGEEMLNYVQWYTLLFNKNRKRLMAQRLMAIKSLLANTNLIISRLELVAGHMAANLAVNVRNPVEGFKITEDIRCWLDSSVTLHLLNDYAQYPQFLCEQSQ